MPVSLGALPLFPSERGGDASGDGWLETYGRFRLEEAAITKTRYAVHAFGVRRAESGKGASRDGMEAGNNRQKPGERFYPGNPHGKTEGQGFERFPACFADTVLETEKALRQRWEEGRLVAFAYTKDPVRGRTRHSPMA